MERRSPQAADFDGCGQMNSLSDIEQSGKMAFLGLIPLNPPAYQTPSGCLSGLSKSAWTAHDLQEIGYSLSAGSSSMSRDRTMNVTG
jgi:hypothetical protein